MMSGSLYKGGYCLKETWKNHFISFLQLSLRFLSALVLMLSSSSDRNKGWCLSAGVLECSTHTGSDPHLVHSMPLFPEVQRFMTEPLVSCCEPGLSYCQHSDRECCPCLNLHVSLRVKVISISILSHTEVTGLAH